MTPDLAALPNPRPAAAQHPTPLANDIGVYLVVHDDVVVHASSPCSTLFSAAVPGGLAGKRFRSLFDGEEVRPGEPWSGALRTHDSAPGDGRTRPLQGRVEATDWQGEEAALVEFESDSVLRAVLHSMHRRETQLDLAIRSANGGLWDLWLDPENPMAPPDECEISDNLQELFGYAPGEMVESVAAYREHILPGDRALLDQAMGDYLRGATARHELEYRIRRKDGEIRWFRSCGQVLVDDLGRPVRWVGVEWDITERREREQEVRRTQRKFTALFRLSPAPIALVTFDEGRFLEVNDSFLRHLGRQRQDVLGCTDRELSIWRDARNRRAFNVELSRQGRVAARRVRMITASGEERAVELSAERMCLEGQDLVLLVGRDVTAELRAEERLRGLAHFDPLTGLPNRNLLEERLERVLAEGPAEDRRTAVLFIDLDRLKAVNDCYGHRAGDEMIQAMAERFRSALRPADLLARLSGDEMVVVARVDEEDQAREIGERLLSALAQPMTLSSGVNLVASASIGIALTERGEAGDGDELMRAADLAMYRVKRRGGGGFELFDALRDSQELADQETTVDLQNCLADDQLILHYQPIVHLDGLAMWGAEALLRWNHPTEGLVMPNRFIPMAERSRLIVPIGSWALAEGCRQLAEWRRDGIVDDDFVLSVNVSAHQLTEESFVAEVEEVLRNSGVPPANLQLEITERVALSARDVATGLRQLGVRLALDDFGEGYGSLSYLRRLPVHMLKVDRSFTRDLAGDAVDLSLVKAIISLAGSLGKEVIAEGVETAEQVCILRAMGCDLAQGFLFAEPLRPDQLAAVAADQRQAASAAANPRSASHRRPASPGGRWPGAEKAGSPLAGEARISRTLTRRSSLENGFARKGRSRPRIPRAVSASSK